MLLPSQIIVVNDLKYALETQVKAGNLAYYVGASKRYDKHSGEWVKGTPDAESVRRALTEAFSDRNRHVGRVNNSLFGGEWRVDQSPVTAERDQMWENGWNCVSNVRGVGVVLSSQNIAQTKTCVTEVAVTLDFLLSFGHKFKAYHGDDYERHITVSKMGARLNDLVAQRALYRCDWYSDREYASAYFNVFYNMHELSELRFFFGSTDVIASGVAGRAVAAMPDLYPNFCKKISARTYEIGLHTVTVSQ